MDPKEELVKSWLDMALRDLESAERLTSGPDPIFDTAFYHCQQAAEKAIKGWLVHNNQRFEKIHDLRVLVSIAETVEPRFGEVLEEAERLTPYATLYRYPGYDQSPDAFEFDQAYRDAEKIVEFIQASIEMGR